jgi:hypothetical protein
MPVASRYKVTAMDQTQLSKKKKLYQAVLNSKEIIQGYFNSVARPVIQNKQLIQKNSEA